MPANALPTLPLWKIERLVPGGRGLAHLSDGRIGFAGGVVPGDSIRVLQSKNHRQFVEALAWELTEPAKQRSQPECPHFERCGGCDWMQLSRSAELEAKRGLLTDALTRVGKLTTLPEIQLIAQSDTETLGYRNRQRFHVSEAGTIGLFAENSHTLVEVAECPVSHREVVRGLRFLREALTNHPEVGKWLSEAEVRYSPLAPSLAVRLVLRRSGFKPELTRGFVRLLEKEFALVTLGKYRAAEAQRWPLSAELEVLVPPAAFVQVNPSINQKLVAAIVAGAQARGAQRFLDLYAGAGNFAIPLCASGLSGVALEHSAPAIAAAVRQAAELKLDTRLAFIPGDVALSLEAMNRKPKPKCDGGGTTPAFDLVVLDPPREGAKAILPTLVNLACEHIAYLACDPVALARDLKTLTASGYQLTDLAIFDMFPRTHHFESLAWLARVPSPRLSEARS